jgi:hypothetical protein
MNNDNKVVVKSVPYDKVPIIIKLSSFNLKRFIIPSNLKINRRNKQISSYEVILPSKDETTFSDMDKDTIFKELKLIRQDLQMISACDVIFDSLNENNVRLSDNKIYLYGYSNVSPCHDVEFAYKANDIKMNELFGHKLLDYENKDIRGISVIDKFYGNFLETSNQYIEDYIKEAVDEDNLSFYLKKKR